MKTMSKLTYRYLRLNKKKAIITIVSIILVTTLLFAISLGASTLRKNNVDDIISYAGSSHYNLENVSFATINYLNSNSDILDIGLSQTIAIKSVGDYNLNVITVSENLKNEFQELSGNFPQSANEIIISSKLAQNQNIDIGSVLAGYEVVGIFEDFPHYFDDYYETYYFVYTNAAFNENGETNFYITFKSTHNAYPKIDNIAKALGLTKHITMYGNVYYDSSYINDNLLAANGEFYLLSTKFAIYGIFATILVVVSVFCVLIVRNSFTISLTERKKQFGALRSIGASKKQIFKMVMIEAGMLSIIAIPLGILLSLTLVSGIIFIFNNLMSSQNVAYQLYLYPEFIIISLIFIVITIFASAAIPALKASKVSPMEAIRLNNVYKIKKSKENYPLIKKIFGSHGEIAYKNMKRNRKVFTSSVISLCIAIVLFLSFATLIDYVLVNSEADFENKYDIVIYVHEEDIIDKIENISAIDEIHYSINEWMQFQYDDFFTDEYLENNEMEETVTFMLIGLDPKSYSDYLNNLGVNDKYNGILVSDNVFKEDGNLKLNLVTKDTIYNYETGSYENIISPSFMTLDNLYLAESYPYSSLPTITLIVNLDKYEEIMNASSKENSFIQYEIDINAKDYKAFDNEMNKIIEENPNVEIDYMNHEIINYNYKMEAIAVSFIFYSILAFIAIISITTVFSSISTNIGIREKEFSVLRSVGLSKAGLNKMLILEGIFLALRVIFWSLLVSIIIIWFIREALKMLSILDKNVIIPYPLSYIIGTIVVVLLLITLVTIYSINKIKKKNIVDSIKNENI